MKSQIEIKTVVTLLIALCALAPTSAARQGPEPNKCTTAGLAKLSSKQMRSRLKHTQAIDPPCCGRNFDLKGTVVLEVVVGENGDVTCVDLVSGDPMVVTSTIQSIAKWRFQPRAEKGQHVAYYGHLAIKFHATERTVTFKVVNESKKTESTPTTH
jgi:outer membrane biosynthesis protein TonB